MSPTLTCLALALVGVDLGYRPASNGGTDFVIHINPATLQALRPGQTCDIDVPRDAREMRPIHFSLTPGNEKLPGEVSVASLLPPTAATTMAASPVTLATAAAPLSSSGGGPVSIPPPTGFAPPPREPQNIPPTYAVSPRSAVAHGGPLLNPSNPVPSPSAGSRIGRLAPVGAEDGTPGQIDRPWLGVCLLVIALLASNVYVFWLFLDARQRFRGLLVRTFSLGQPATEA